MIGTAFTSCQTWRKSLPQRCCRAADLRQYESGLISSSFLSSAFLCEAAHLPLYTLDNNLVVCQRLQSDYCHGRRGPEHPVSCFSPTSSPLPSRFYDDCKGSDMTFQEKRQMRTPCFYSIVPSDQHCRSLNSLHDVFLQKQLADKAQDRFSAQQTET
mgnify:CR=1 FL=1